MKNNMKSLLALFTLLTLAGCGKEQFGGATQSESNTVNSVAGYQQMGCDSGTTIKPKVDILFVVDNSLSNTYLTSSIRSSIQGTIDSISNQFDYRVVGIGLLPKTSNPNSSFQFMTNSSDTSGLSSISSNRILKSSEFTFFQNLNDTVSSQSEAGLRRVSDFMGANPGGIFRTGAYHLVVMVSNGFDREVEMKNGFGKIVRISQAAYDSRINALNAVKAQLQSLEFRFMAVTAQSACQEGWLPSTGSYVTASASMGNSGDAYDLCNTAGIPKIFAKVNESIKQIEVKYTFAYWPITFTDSDNIDTNAIKVYVSTPDTQPALLDSSKWSYYSNASRTSINTRTLPTPGNPSTARHMIKFNAGSEIVTPKCISVTSTTKTEYFGWIVLPREPQEATIVVRINGVTIPQSNTNGWSYIGNSTRSNVKVPYPQNGDELPAISKSGYMIQLNGSGNYYKSGDSVETYYIGAGI